MRRILIIVYCCKAVGGTFKIKIEELVMTLSVKVVSILLVQYLVWFFRYDRLALFLGRSLCLVALLSNRRLRDSPLFDIVLVFYCYVLNLGKFSREPGHSPHRVVLENLEKRSILLLFFYHLIISLSWILVYCCWCRGWVVLNLDKWDAITRVNIAYRSYVSLGWANLPLLLEL